MAKNKNGLTTLTEISAEIGIDKDDVVAIKVAQIETQLIQAQHEAEQKRRDLKAKIKSANAKFEAALQAQADRTFDPSEAVKALKALGIKVNSSVNIQFDDKKSQLDVCLTLTKEGVMYGSSFSSQKSVKVNRDVIGAKAKLDGLTDELEEVQVKLVDIRKRLSQISTLERQAKAAIATAAIKGTDKGDALLKALDSIPGLPSL